MILLFRGITLEGYWKGVEYFVTPRWNHLGEAKVNKIIQLLSTSLSSNHTQIMENYFLETVINFHVVVTVAFHAMSHCLTIGIWERYTWKPSSCDPQCNESLKHTLETVER